MVGGMKYILLKTFRDIRETIGSFISILVVIFIGCFFFAGIIEATSAVTKQVDGYAADLNTASARAAYMYVNSAAVDEIGEAEGVKLAAGYNTFYAKLKGTRTDVTLTTLTPDIDKPDVLRGKLPERKKDDGFIEIIVDKVYAEAHKIKLGDTMELTVDTLDKIELPSMNMSYKKLDYKCRVSGIYHAIDVLYKVDVMNTAATAEEFVMAMVNVEDVPLFTDTAGIYSGANPILPFSSLEQSGITVYNGIRTLGTPENAKEVFGAYTVDTEDAQQALKQIQDMLESPSAAAGLFVNVMEFDEYPAVVAYDGINDAISALAAVLPFIFFAVAAAITVISLSKTVDNQRMQIGVIQAIGVGKGAVYFSYIFYALFACVIGGLTGGIVGTYTVPYLLEFIYEGQFAMPPTPLDIGVLYLFLGVVVAAALACVSAFLSCHRTLKAVPAQAMRPKPPKKTKRILAERWTGLWKRLGFGAKMNLRNMFLHKIRMLLSSVGIVGCLALLIGLVGLKDNMAFSFNHYDAQSGYDMAVYLLDAADVAAEYAKMEESGTVEKLTFVPAFSAKFTHGKKSADQTVMALPSADDVRKYEYCDVDCVKLYTDMSQKTRLKLKTDTFAIPEYLADKLDVKAGDVVTISGRALDGKTAEFDVKVTDIVYEYFEQKAYCSYGFFEERGIALAADTAYVNAARDAEINAVAKKIENAEGVRGVQTFRESFGILEDRMSLLDYAVILFVIGAGVLAVAVIYNITATNLKERTREIATLMVLGYKKRETANMLIVENMVITAIGCLLGLPLGFLLLKWLVGVTETFGVFISSFMSWYTALGCMALTFLFSLVATMFLNRKMKKISMVEALKSVE